MRRQKHKIEHGTCDKKFLTPPPIRTCPLLDEPKKGGFFFIFYCVADKFETIQFLSHYGL